MVYSKNLVNEPGIVAGREGTSRWLKALIAGLVSLIAPGTGHIYAGRPRKGLSLWMLGTALPLVAVFAGAMATFAGTVLILVFPITVWVYSALSAVREARRAVWARLGKGRWITIAGLLVCQVLIASLPIRAWLPIHAFRIPSGSMEPTLQIGDFLVADMRAWDDRGPKPGDLVIYRNPGQEGSIRLSRVIAVGGQRIEIRDKEVYVNSVPIEDPWAVHIDPRTLPSSPFVPESLRTRDHFPAFVVPEGSVFVLSDNRDNAADSRFTGPIDRTLVLGRPLHVYWSANPARIGLSLVGK